LAVAVPHGRKIALSEKHNLLPVKGNFRPEDSQVLEACLVGLILLQDKSITVSETCKGSVSSCRGLVGSLQRVPVLPVSPQRCKIFLGLSEVSLVKLPEREADSSLVFRASWVEHSDLRDKD
jgi:hypothetical protein